LDYDIIFGTIKTSKTAQIMSGHVAGDGLIKVQDTAGTKPRYVTIEFTDIVNKTYGNKIDADNCFYRVNPDAEVVAVEDFYPLQVSNHGGEIALGEPVQLFHRDVLNGQKGTMGIGTASGAIDIRCNIPPFLKP